MTYRGKNHLGSIERTKAEVAGTIEKFLDGTGGRWDWDDFCCLTISDPYLDSVRIQCSQLSLTCPPSEKGHYCSQVGFEIMQELASKLRAAK
jgi:hypothetical protein